MNNRTLVIRARKHTGTITALALFFSRKNIPVEQMLCSTVQGADEMVCTVTYQCSGRIKYMIPHISKMHDVIDVCFAE